MFFQLSTILFKDALVFMKRNFDENNLNNEKYFLDCINTIIQLKDVVKCDFDLDNNGL